MKLEALERTVVTAREQARGLETKVRQLTQAARDAKDKAKLAKTKLKVARQEAKRTRRMAKDAKRTLAEVVAASDAAANELARLENKIKKARKKAPQSQSVGKHPKLKAKAKPIVSKQPLRSPHPISTRSQLKASVSAKPSVPAMPERRPVLKRAKLVSPQRGGEIHVPRDFDPKPSLTPPASLPEAESPAAPTHGPGS